MTNDTDATDATDAAGTAVDATTTVRRSVTVEVAIEQAFAFFTEDIGAWWDPNKHLLAEPVAEMVFEPRVGGRIIDRGVNGAESCWATILVYDPPTHVAFSWDIDPAWQIEHDPAKRSEVHVTFTALAQRRTLVELEHRHLERHGERWQAVRDAVGSPGGWDLEPYAAALAAHVGSGGGAVADAVAPVGYRAEVRLAKPPIAAFDALCTLDGLAGWWSPVSGSPATGGELRVSHRRPGTLVIVVEEASLEQVRWRVTSYALNPDWDGTRIVFALESDGASGTLIRFQHRGLVPTLSCFESCRTGWERFLESLRDYVATGVGNPLLSDEEV